MKTAQEIGLAIKTARTSREMTQEELAGKMYVSRQAVSKWETGEAVPETDKLVELAKIFELSLDSLILGKEVTNRNVATQADEWQSQSAPREVSPAPVNFWTFVERSWWMIFPLLGVIAWFISRISH